MFSTNLFTIITSFKSEIKSGNKKKSSLATLDKIAPTTQDHLYALVQRGIIRNIKGEARTSSFRKTACSED